MSRNRKEMSAEIFRRIDIAALNEDASYVADSNARWIARKDEVDARLMAEARVVSLPLGMRTIAVFLEHEDKKYFCFSGLQIPDEPPRGLFEIPATPGLFAAVISETEMPALTTAARARDLLQDQHSGVSDYTGHELDAVMQVFPQMHFYEVSADVEASYLSSLERVTGSYVARGYPGYPLALTHATRSRFIELFESGANTIPYYLSLQGILSYTWSALFLEMYRCIEQLYSAPRLSILSERLNHAGPLSELAELLEGALSWRPREEESLSSILDIVSPDTRSMLVSAALEYRDQSECTGARCASHIYRIRNSHVHFRPALRVAQFKHEQWNSLIQAMCDAVCEAYEYFGDRFLAAN